MSKPYYTDEENEKHYRFCLYDAMMSGNLEKITHYTYMLDYLKSKKSNEIDSLRDFITSGSKISTAAQKQLEMAVLSSEGHEKKERSKGVIHWYPCQQYGEMVKENSTVCPKCGTQFDVELARELENREINITVEVEPVPYSAHVVKQMRIKRLTPPHKIIETMIEKGIINDGNYEEKGIILDEDRLSAQASATDERVWKRYADYKDGDIVFFRRNVSLDEIIQAHLTYIGEKYSDKQLFSKRKISVLDHNSQDKNKIKQISIYGCAGKSGIIQALGYHEARFENYPEVMIPFETGKIPVDAIACELKDEPLIIYGRKHTPLIIL